MKVRTYNQAQLHFAKADSQQKNAKENTFLLSLFGVSKNFFFGNSNALKKQKMK